MALVVSSRIVITKAPLDDRELGGVRRQKPRCPTDGAVPLPTYNRPRQLATKPRLGPIGSLLRRRLDSAHAKTGPVGRAVEQVLVAPL